MSSSSEQPSKAQVFFQTGNDAAMKQNWDYAIEMYVRSCKLDPGNLLYRQTLRAAQKKKFQGDPAKVGRLVGMKNQPIRMRARMAKSKSKWTETLEICEEAFLNNPWDVDAAKEAAEASEQLGYLLLAQWYVESVQAQAKDVDFFIFAAGIHRANKSFPKAIQCWEKVKKLDPNNQIANREINALSAGETIHKSGIGDAIDERDAKPDPAAEMEELRIQRQTPEERYMIEIKEDPTKVYPYLQLSEIYKNRGKLKEASELLARGRKAVPGNTDLQHATAEVHIALFKSGIDQCNARLKDRPDDATAKSKLEEIQQKLNDYEIQEFKRRLTLEPSDMNLQFQLGLRLVNAKRYDEAIGAFQQVSQNSPPLKVQALHRLGLCFYDKGNHKLAERTLQEALKLADAKDIALTNALHYWLGRVSEAQGNTVEAEDHYNEVAANDYNYLDVAERLRNL
ncbi:tetratricopeptide repeat protein [Singulisphaera sp. PoT]|uniref:tetratricopeptide repeat protein n=1 Tax=Singulisphaera sp. PoT TaxID=3411797 RepID=UPI003BF4FCF3